MATPTNTQFAVAVHVLTYLATVGASAPVSSDELSQSVNASPVYIRRVLAPLRQSGLVASTPGPKGGWILTREAAAISLAEVWKVVQNGYPVLGMHGPNPLCPLGINVQKALVTIDQEVADAVFAGLSARTIGDVLSDAEKAAVVAAQAHWPPRR